MTEETCPNSDEKTHVCRAWEQAGVPPRWGAMFIALDRYPSSALRRGGTQRERYHPRIIRPLPTALEFCRLVLL